MQVKLFSCRGDDVLLEYDPATADMAEVNREVDHLEKQFAGPAYNLDTGDKVDHVTRETSDVTIIPQIAGG